jgi:hypothetical protein
MNTPLREAIQREVRRREARQAANASEKVLESSPKQELHGKEPGAASQVPFQGEPASAPQGQGFSEKTPGASGNAGAPAQFPGHPLPTTRSGGREIATAAGQQTKGKEKRGGG